MPSAQDFILTALSPGPRPAKEILFEASLAGVPTRTLYAAKARLGVRSEAGPTGWTWHPPRNRPATRTDKREAPRAVGPCCTSASAVLARLFQSGACVEPSEHGGIRLVGPAVEWLDEGLAAEAHRHADHLRPAIAALREAARRGVRLFFGDNAGPVWMTPLPPMLERVLCEHSSEVRVFAYYAAPRRSNATQPVEEE
jgi:hypothetical protein